jgi:hypothetical protein
MNFYEWYDRDKEGFNEYVKEIDWRSVACCMGRYDYMAAMKLIHKVMEVGREDFEQQDRIDNPKDYYNDEGVDELLEKQRDEEREEKLSRGDK